MMKIKERLKLEYVVAVLALAVQVLIINCAYFVPGWDSKVVLDNAHMVATDNTYLFPEYFSVYPNNLLTMYIFAAIKAVIGRITFDDWILSLKWILYFQCLLNTIGGLLVFKINERHAGRKVAWISYVFYLVLVAFSPWILVAYTDSLSVIFSILILFIYFNMVSMNKADVEAKPEKDAIDKGAEESKNNKKVTVVLKELLPYMLIGVASAVAYNIKPQPLILFIAIVGVTVLYNLVNKKFIKLISQVGVMAAAFLLIYFSIKIPTYYCNPVIDRDAALGMTHFLMMGANIGEDGGYNEGDYDFSNRYATKGERSKAELAEYFRRVSEAGFTEYAGLVGKKLIDDYSDGEFGWPAYVKNGEPVNEYFYKSMYDDHRNSFERSISSAMYGEGNRHRLLTILRNIFWFATLLLVAAGIFLQKNSWEKLVLYLSLLGLILFSALFEYGARYVYTFAVVFIITAMQTIYAIIGKIKAKRAA